jgi:hypothetical protein
MTINRIKKTMKKKLALGNILLWFALQPLFIVNAQNITVGLKATGTYEDGENHARIDFVSVYPDLQITEVQGETVRKPEKTDSGYVYTCICDVSDTNNFRFRIFLLGSEDVHSERITIRAGEWKTFAVEVADIPVIISEVNVLNRSQVVRKENTAAVTVSCKFSRLTVQSKTGEPVEGPTLNSSNGLFEYTIYYDLSSESSRKISRALRFSVDNVEFQDHEIGILSPKQGVEISVVVVQMAKYLSYKTSAEQFYASGRYGEASEAYTQAQNSPDKPADMNFTDQIIRATRCLMELNRANSLFMAEKWADAKDAYTNLLEQNPGDHFVAQKIRDCDLKLEPPKAFPPTVATGTVTDVKTDSFRGSGNVDNTGGLPVSARGICWSVKNQEPTVDDDKTVTDGELGDYTCEAAGLLPNRVYHVRAFAQNSAGVAYGRVTTVTTKRGEPWTQLYTIAKNGDFAQLLYRNRCTFSNGKYLYSVATAMSDEVYRYNPFSGAVTMAGKIQVNNGRIRRLYSQSVVIDNIAYVAVLVDGGNRETIRIIRYNMDEGIFLPVFDTGVNISGENLTLEVMCGFAIGKICYFMLNQGSLLAYNPESVQNRFKRIDRTRQVWLSDCTAFSVGNKGYVAYTGGELEEFDPAGGKWTDKNAAPLQGSAYEISSFSLNGKGYVYFSRGKGFFEYNPASGAWKACSQPSGADDGSVIPFDANRGFVGTKSSYTPYFYMYDPMQENF